MSLQTLRNDYHRAICSQVLGRRAIGGSFSNADTGSTSSRAIAEEMAARLPYPMCSQPPSGQRSGSLLAIETASFLKQALALFPKVRPGPWDIALTQGADRIAAFYQYSHLADLRALGRADPTIRWLLNVDYLVAPDITIGRPPMSDVDLDPDGALGLEASGLASYTPMRARPGSRPHLHASISCKWTIRSDRAQNSRTEALNLLRNRKGRAPNIVVVTFEPLPSRLASIAAGTGDIDCTYHGALTELRAAVDVYRDPEQGEILEALIEGQRLRDIADLPFDLLA